MKKSFLKESLETAKIAVELTLWGLKWPPDVQVEDETCSTIFGTHVQAILDHEKLTGWAGGSGKVKICPRNCLDSGLKPSRGHKMGQRPLNLDPKWSHQLDKFEPFWTINIATGTTDPRVEFISQVQSQILIKFHVQNLD